jgi:hypothetical protein
MMTDRLSLTRQRASRTRRYFLALGWAARGATLVLCAMTLVAPAVFGQVAAPASASGDSQWIRPVKAGDPLIWGRRDGIVFGLPSAGGLRGPRGLIRVGVVPETTGQPELLNFVAIEPVTAGPGSRFSRMAFSELEPSQMDAGLRGKRLWIDPDAYQGQLQSFSPGEQGIDRPEPAVETLSVKINVERFSANGAHVYVIASIASDHPDELRLAVYQCPDSSALEELTLTATMGNYERLRQLWLKDRVVTSLNLFASYQGDAFVEHENYPLDEMLRNADGDAIVLATSNEVSPTSAPNTAAPYWHYPFSRRLTQYWRVPAHDIEPDLRVRVNARRVYWQSHNPLPGGVAFENFEVRERYEPGQTFIFGVTPKEPWELDPPIPHVQAPSGSH